MPSGGERIALFGPAMVPLVRAISAVVESDLGAYAIVGGIAVTARLGHAHRATGDVDAVVDESTPPDAVEALLGRVGVEPDPTASHRVYVEGTKVEFLGVGPLDEADLAGVPDDDALFVAAHVWALETATPLTVVAATDDEVVTTARFAAPGGLFAMKLHAIQTRSASGADKRSGDAWDLYRLLLDLDAGGVVRAQLAAAPSRLRQLVAEATNRVLGSGANRTVGWLRGGGDQMASVTAEELRYLAEPLIVGLSE
jgi:hypothetical protein